MRGCILLVAMVVVFSPPEPGTAKFVKAAGIAYDDI